MEPTSAPDPRWPAPSALPLPVPDPVAPVVGGTPRRPRLWVGLSLLCLGVVFLVAGFVGLAIAPAPDDYPAVDVPGTRSLTLDDGTTYTLYLESDGTEPGGTPPSVRVTGPTGDAEPLLDPDPMALDYTTLSNREGRPFASIRPGVTGVYRFSTDLAAGERADDGLLVTVGSDEGEVASGIAFAMAGLGLLAVVAGVIVLVVRAVRHRRPPSGVTNSPSPGTLGREPGP